MIHRSALITEMCNFCQMCNIVRNKKLKFTHLLPLLVLAANSLELRCLVVRYFQKAEVTCQETLQAQLKLRQDMVAQDQCQWVLDEVALGQLFQSRSLEMGGDCLQKCMTLMDKIYLILYHFISCDAWILLTFPQILAYLCVFWCQYDTYETKKLKVQSKECMDVMLS